MGKRIGAAAMVMPRRRSATTLPGLSGPAGSGLPAGGVEAVRSEVLSNGTYGVLSRLRFGDG
jgi:hypothetical protein